MRTGPNTELNSHQVLTIWKKVKANGGKWNEFRLCRYCGGNGQKTDRISKNPAPKECPHCRSWGFVRMGTGQ